MQYGGALFEYSIPVPKTTEELNAMSVDGLWISARSKKELKKSGITTVGLFMKQSPETLQKILGIGKSLDDVLRIQKILSDFVPSSLRKTVMGRIVEEKDAKSELIDLVANCTRQEAEAVLPEAKKILKKMREQASD